jgi:diacylglycerol kinase
MMKHSRPLIRELKKRVRSFGFAGHGVWLLVRTQIHFRIHLTAATVVCLLGAYLNITRVEWIALVVVIGAVLIAEGFNTALEFLTDLVSPDYHELAKRSKDVAAGAVLLAALMALAVGFLIFAPYLLTAESG